MRYVSVITLNTLNRCVRCQVRYWYCTSTGTYYTSIDTSKKIATNQAKFIDPGDSSLYFYLQLKKKNGIRSN